MSHTRKLPFLGIVSAVLVISFPLAYGETVAQTASMPSQVEREYWDATRQIDSVAGYQAYLTRFPNGFYAPLASAAIKKADGAVPTTSQPRPRPTEERKDSPPSAARLEFVASKIAGPTNSGAITQQAGDVFHGPGPITVGWIGARKQILIPRGDWILLAAEDNLASPSSSYGSSMSTGGTNFIPPMLVTTLVLAKLEDRTVRSFLLARFNGKEGSPKFPWSDALECGSSSRPALFTWRDRSLWIKQCAEASLYAHSDKNVTKVFSGAIWEKAFEMLTMGGGTLPSSSFLVTDMYYTGDSSNYLKISRVDFGVSSEYSDPGVPKSSIDLSLQGREQWARAYSELAVLGYRQKLTEGDLKPGSSPSMAVDTLPD